MDHTGPAGIAPICISTFTINSLRSRRRVRVEPGPGIAEPYGSASLIKGEKNGQSWIFSGRVLRNTAYANGRKQTSARPATCKMRIETCRKNVHRFIVGGNKAHRVYRRPGMVHDLYRRGMEGKLRRGQFAGVQFPGAPILP
jgi:hypothetical protein